MNKEKVSDKRLKMFSTYLSPSNLWYIFLEKEFDESFKPLFKPACKT